MAQRTCWSVPVVVVEVLARKLRPSVLLLDMQAALAIGMVILPGQSMREVNMAPRASEAPQTIPLRKQGAISKVVPVAQDRMVPVVAAADTTVAGVGAPIRSQALRQVPVVVAAGHTALVA